MAKEFNVVNGKPNRPGRYLLMNDHSAFPLSIRLEQRGDAVVASEGNLDQWRLDTATAYALQWDVDMGRAYSIAQWERTERIEALRKRALALLTVTARNIESINEQLEIMVAELDGHLNLVTEAISAYTDELGALTEDCQALYDQKEDTWREGERGERFREVMDRASDLEGVCSLDQLDVLASLEANFLSTEEVHKVVKDLEEVPDWPALRMSA